MLHVALLPHSTAPEPAVTGLSVDITRTPDGQLQLDYRLAGEVSAIRAEGLTELRRADRLWEHTCFELFLRVSGAAAYCELNFSTSGAWAAYRFSDYRTDMQPIAPLRPALQVQRGDAALRLQATVPLAELHPAHADAQLQLAPSAVIEHVTGRRSFWAAHHAAAKPDFHHAGAFVVTLAPSQH